MKKHIFDLVITVLLNFYIVCHFILHTEELSTALTRNGISISPEPPSELHRRELTE